MSEDTPELLRDRTIVKYTPLDVGFHVTLSCGHTAIFMTEPYRDWSNPCAQCVADYVLKERSHE